MSVSTFMKYVLLIAFISFYTSGIQAQSTIPEEIQKGKSFFEKGHYSEAEAVFQQIIAQYENTHEVNTGDYATALNGLANVYRKKGQSEKADLLFSEACQLRKEADENGLEYAETLTDWAMLQSDIGRLDQLEDRLNSALKIIEGKTGKQSLEYAKTLCISGHCYISTGNPEKGIAQVNQSKTICLDVASDQHTLYADILVSIGNYYLLAQNLTEAERCYSQAKEIYHTALGAAHLDYLSTQLLLALVYSYTSRFQDAINILLPILPLIENSVGKESQYYIAAIANLGGVCTLLDKPKEAEPYLLATLELAGKSYGEAHPYYFNAVNTLATLYKDQGLYEKAERFYIQSLQLRKKLYGEQHIAVVRALSNLGVLYYDMRMDENAEKYLREALQIAENAGLKNSNEYANILANLAGPYARRQSKEALHLYEQAEQIFRENQAESHPTFLNFISNKLQYIANNSILSDDAVESLFLENLRQKDQLFGAYSLQSLLTTAKLGDFYYTREQYEKAEDCYNRYIAHATPFATSSVYTSILFNMGMTQEQLRNRGKACDYFLQSFSKIKNNIRPNFAFLSEKEREMWWKQTSIYLNGFRAFSRNEWNNKNDTIAGFAYNNELLSKGILLSTARNVNEAVINSNDAELAALWKNLSDLKNRLIKEEANPSVSAADKEALLGQAQEMEKLLLRKLQPYQDLQNLFNRTWKDVQKDLSPKEMAIEFSVIYPNYSTADTIYCALLLRPEYEYPQLVELCREHELQAAIRQSPYDGIHVYPLIWKPLEKYLDGVNEIFLAPVGLLHGVSFVGMKTENGYLGEVYTIRQLLSTKDIASVKHKNVNENPKRHIALFGGADYGLPSGEMAMLDVDLKKDHTFRLTRSMLDYMNSSRGQGFDYLPGSKKEVQSIAQQLSERHWHISLFIDKEATETRFKSFSSQQSPEILHVSTHGFYFPLAKTDVSFFDHEANTNRFRLSDNPLMRSGLVFTGANQVWSDKQAPEDNTDDGILTAYEVSNLNLSNTQLVVLSACETGLGDIVGSEGNYGLLRAFRLAGAKAMLVSLWKVPDKETLELMTAFYAQWTQEHNLSQAFSKARQAMRKAYPDQPEKWAGFALVE